MLFCDLQFFSCNVRMKYAQIGPFCQLENFSLSKKIKFKNMKKISKASQNKLNLCCELYKLFKYRIILKSSFQKWNQRFIMIVSSAKT